MRIQPIFVRVEEDMIGDLMSVIEETKFVEEDDGELIFCKELIIEKPLENLKPSWRRKEIQNLRANYLQDIFVSKLVLVFSFKKN